MNNASIRLAVSKAYPGEKWQHKVKKMTDDQALAIYMSLKKRGVIKV